jgi:urease accessory protein
MGPSEVPVYDLAMHEPITALPEENDPATARAGVLERTSGRALVRVARSGIAELYQEGALRLRPTRSVDPVEIVAINTAGGLTGGDLLDLTVVLDSGTAAVVTTPACDKIYRSADGDAVVVNTLRLGSESQLDWLPQPMIVFDGARIHRRLDFDMAVDATLLAVEGVILGRTAMAEEITSGAIHDAWRLRRGGKLVYADAFRATGDARASLSGRATLGGARAFGTLLYAAPDAEQRLDMARHVLAGLQAETGASAWNGILAVRFLAADGQALIADVSAFLSAFRGLSLPRSWLC